MVEDSTVEIHHLARLMTVLPCSILVRPFLMKPALVLSPTFSRETQSGFFFQRGNAIFRPLQGCHKAEKADEVCVAQGTDSGPTSRYYRETEGFSLH